MRSSWSAGVGACRCDRADRMRGCPLRVQRLAPDAHTAQHPSMARILRSRWCLLVALVMGCSVGDGESLRARLENRDAGIAVNLAGSGTTATAPSADAADAGHRVYLPVVFNDYCAGGEVTLMTYNIAAAAKDASGDYLYGDSAPILDRVAAMIVDRGVDVAALQEVSRWEAVHGGGDMREQLLSALQRRAPSENLVGRVWVPLQRRGWKRTLWAAVGLAATGGELRRT